METIKLFFNKNSDWATIHPGSNDIELSYHACGTLSHLLSDPDRIWFFPKQQAAMVVQQAVDSWDINARRHINYRSVSTYKAICVNI